LTNEWSFAILVNLVKESAMAEFVSLYDAKTHLSALVDRAADGEEIVIMKAGKPLARLMPVNSGDIARTPAGALGVTRLDDDFDAPLPDALQAAFEGR
jgi:prevent-host-death family protein